jgi:hypothetical protein
MRTPALNSALERALSVPRLGRYLADSNQIVDAALSLYERNARIAEAFYRPLQSLEICLRNQLNLQLVSRYGTHWFNNGGPPFEADAIAKIDNAIVDLRQAGKAITPGAVVAELSFGFWVMILARKYDATLWRSTCSAAFRESGRRLARQRVHNRMDEIRRFRNRVMHHEPVYHRDPATMHADIIQAIAWMCPDSAAWAWEHSRVPYVLENPWPAL